MLKRIIIVATIVLVPLAFYVASQYGSLESVTFEQAIKRSEHASSEEQAPKMIITSTILRQEADRWLCEDRYGVQFSVEYTGKPPDKPFTEGSSVDFVGHVHGTTPPYFHATQVYSN